MTPAIVSVFPFVFVFVSVLAFVFVFVLDLSIDLLFLKREFCLLVLFVSSESKECVNSLLFV